LRPVEAGYERIKRMVFLGSMMNTCGAIAKSALVS
jgi:hypothetical protein